MSEHHQANFSQDQVLSLLSKHYSLAGELNDLPSYIDQNFLLIANNGTRYIVKIANAAEPEIELDMQNQMMTYLSSSKLPYEFPVVSQNADGQSITQVSVHEKTYLLRVLSFVEGTFYADSSAEKSTLQESLATMMAHISNALEDFTHPAVGRFLIWDLKQASNVIRRHLSFINEGEQIKKVTSILNSFENNVLPIADSLPVSVIHNDANDYNVLTKGDAATGLIDFGDMVETWHINELVIAITYALLGEDSPAKIIADMTLAYHKVRPLTAEEVSVIFPLVCARLATSVCNSAKAIVADPDNEYLLISAKPAWQAIDQLLAIDEVSIGLKLAHACGYAPSSMSNEYITEYRQKHLSKTLSLSYQDPLQIIRGKGVFLYDETGQGYLDMVNNVCHVGHCHPDVVRAGQIQLSQLNTNTRFLHPNIINYSKKLLATFPEKLSVVFFVNSGSEANELAMRLVKAHTGSDNMIVVEGAYHGHTNKAIEISPYKFNGRGGEGASDNIQVVPMPDPFRGEFIGHSEESGKGYADYVAKCVAERKAHSQPLGGFICESLQGVGGNLVMPDGYLKHAYEAVRAHGGLCLADEVQVGFGRVGSHWWGFETQDVVPDIVTIGKPIGNGHPLAAVVTSPEVAASFVTGMEYFNTYGGNPVSCAIGSAVLDVIENEKLRENAKTTGAYFIERLTALANTYQTIGDVRGLGLFLGVELVKDRHSKEPATELAKQCIEALKSKHILLSLDGPFGNVFKIKPPIVFNKTHVDDFITKLVEVFETLNVK